MEKKQFDPSQLQEAQVALLEKAALQLGKSLEFIHEAIRDALDNEFERLKELGITTIVQCPDQDPLVSIVNSIKAKVSPEEGVLSAQDVAELLSGQPATATVVFDPSLLSQKQITFFEAVAHFHGRTMDDFHQAVTDALACEFERLKEFGFKVTVPGQSVEPFLIINFHGETTNVAYDPLTGRIEPMDLVSALFKFSEPQTKANPEDATDRAIAEPLAEEEHEDIKTIRVWMDSEDKDYQAGLWILSRHCRNRVLINNLSRKESAANLDKITYELSKLLANPLLLSPQARQEKPALVLQAPAVPFKPSEPAVEQTAPEAAATSPETAQTPEKTFISERDALVESLRDKAESQLTDIEKIILQQGQIYTEKAKLSNSLAALGDSNDPDVVQKRKAIVDDITYLEEKYNALAEAKKLLELVPSQTLDQTIASNLTTATDATVATGPAAAEPAVDKAALLVSRDNKRSQVSKAKSAVSKDPDNVTKQEKLCKLQAELQEIQDQIDLLP